MNPHPPTSECVAFATKVLGDKWSPRLLFALSRGHVRFCELQSQGGGINPRTLSQRLLMLEALGIIYKTALPDSPSHSEYHLTPKGEDLIPILRRMAAWGEKYASP